MASFPYCFPYSYRSPNYCDSNSCRTFTHLKALAKSNDNLFAIAFKSDNYHYCDSWKSDNFRMKAIKKEAKNWYQKGCYRNIGKFEWLYGTIFISYFGGSNNIFANYTHLVVVPSWCWLSRTTLLCARPWVARVSRWFSWR